jgi:hypothetical protein
MPSNSKNGSSTPKVKLQQVEHCNNIIQLSEMSGLEVTPSNNEVARKCFGIGENSVSFSGSNLFKYEEAVEALFKDFREDYTRKKFESELIAHLGDKFSAKEKINKEIFTSFKKKLTEKPVQEFFVLREIHGLILTNLSAPYVLGPFSIYHFPSHHDILNFKTKISPDSMWGGDTPNYLIETKVNAKHFEKATEKADILFEKFELTLKYAMDFKDDRYEVGIQTYRGTQHRSAYVFSKDGAFSSINSTHGSLEPIPINDPYFTSSNTGFDRMWAAMASEEPTELQRRLLLAIEWIGQSYNEVSLSSAFIKSAIALEILFTRDINAFIDKSVVGQLSESIALLLGKDVEMRLDIESRFKKLYGVRSQIAHKGKTDVSQEDLLSIRHLSKTVVIKLMTTPSIRDLDSAVQLYEYLRKQKYSCAAI